MTELMIRPEDAGNIKELELLPADLPKLGGSGAVSPATLTVYNKIIGGFKEWIQDQGLTYNGDTVRQIVIDYFDHLKGRPAKTQKLTKDALKRAFKWQYGRTGAINSYYIDEFFKQDIKTTSPTSQAIEQEKYLDLQQVGDLIAAADPRTATIIEFLFLTGCRAAEMLNIRMSDCEVNGQVKVRVKGKGDFERFATIPKELFTQIILVHPSPETAAVKVKSITGPTDQEAKKILKAARSREFLFCSYNRKAGTTTQLDRGNVFRILARLGDKVLGKKVNLHMLRHSYAMDLKRRGHTAEAIKHAMGHRNVATTIEHYFHDTVDQVEHVTTVHDELHTKKQTSTIREIDQDEADQLGLLDIDDDFEHYKKTGTVRKQ